MIFTPRHLLNHRRKFPPGIFFSIIYKFYQKVTSAPEIVDGNRGYESSIWENGEHSTLNVRYVIILHPTWIFIRDKNKDTNSSERQMYICVDENGHWTIPELIKEKVRLDLGADCGNNLRWL